MSVRRWIGIGGVALAVVAGFTATAPGRAEAEFEAQVSVLLNSPHPRGVPVPALAGPERLFKAPEVTELVRSRLGRTPPVRVTAAANDTVLLRSRGATPGEATEATKTYAASYVEVQRRRVEAATASAAEQVRGKVDQVESQIASAEEPERSSLRGLLGHLNTQLDRLRPDLYGPRVVDLSPAQPVDHGAGGAWIAAALGASVAVGTAVSAPIRSRDQRAASRR